MGQGSRGPQPAAGWCHVLQLGRHRQESEPGHRWPSQPVPEPGPQSQEAPWTEDRSLEAWGKGSPAVTPLQGKKNKNALHSLSKLPACRGVWAGRRQMEEANAACLPLRSSPWVRRADRHQLRSSRWRGRDRHVWMFRNGGQPSGRRDMREPKLGSTQPEERKTRRQFVVTGGVPEGRT